MNFSYQASYNENDLYFERTANTVSLLSDVEHTRLVLQLQQSADSMLNTKGDDAMPHGIL